MYNFLLFQINDKIILKSGTDFREFSVVTLNEEGSCVGVDIQKVEVNSSFEPDSELKEALSEFEGRFQIKTFLQSEKKVA